MATYTPDMPIAAMLRARFDELKPMTQTEAGLACGVEQSSFNRWMNGNAAPKPEHVAAVARYLGAEEAVVLAGIQNYKMAPKLPAAAEATRYLTEQLIKFQDLVPDEMRQEADEVMADIFRWLPGVLEATAIEELRIAANKGNKRKPAKRKPRPSPEPNE